MASDKEIHNVLVSGQSEGKTVRTLKARGLTGSRHQILHQIGRGGMSPHDVVTPVDQAAAQTRSIVAETVKPIKHRRKATKRKAPSSRSSQSKRKRTNRSSSTKRKKKRVIGKKKRKIKKPSRKTQKGKGSKPKGRKKVQTKKRKTKTPRASTSDVFTRRL